MSSVQAMRVRQFVGLSVASESLPVDQITAALGAQPDRRSDRGSRSVSPPMPRWNVWGIEVLAPGMCVDDQLEALLVRARPLVARIRGLTEHGGCTAELRIVRHFNDDDGEEEAVDDAPGHPLLRKMPRQHHLLGWHLDSEVLRFIADAGWSLDVDEYG